MKISNLAHGKTESLNVSVASGVIYMRYLDNEIKQFKKFMRNGMKLGSIQSITIYFIKIETRKKLKNLLII